MAKSGTSSHASLHKDLMKACAALEARYGERKPTKTPDFIEALIYQTLELGVPEKLAKDAMKRIHDEFIDWNDMRAASVRELEDILGPKYYRCREKAEDLKHLLADLYTAFRKMDLSNLLNQQGIETLRALPETTLIRKDFVERALLLVLDVKVCPIDEEQFRLLKFLGGVPKPLTFQQALKRIEESLDPDEMLRLSRGLREHTHVLNLADQSEPQPISFGLKEEKAASKGTEKTSKGTEKTKKKK